MNYQDPRQALTVNSPLLSYINIWHQGFLPPRLTVGEARDLGPQLIRVGSLVPVREGSTNTVFHSRTEHIPVEQPPEGAQAIEQVEVESVDSSGVEAEDPSEEMVVCRNMTANQFLLGGRTTTQ